VVSGGEMFGLCEGVFIYVRMVIPREKLRDDCGVALALVEPDGFVFHPSSLEGLAHVVLLNN
jgi:hypothetical protein